MRDEPGGHRAARREHLVRDHDRARPRRLPRLGRLRGDGPLAAGCSPRSASRCGRSGTSLAAGDVVADGPRRRRRRSSRRSFMHFGGSWVFLYPLPFHGAGQWGDWATALFSASVLLAGLSIVTWCLAILAHRARAGAARGQPGISTGSASRSASATCGRSASRPTRAPVPYAVIPLTVIAIDMIIATLPLAALLVEMIVQSFSPSVARRPAAREEHPLVVRPPGRLPAALPGGRDLLLRSCRARGAAARRRQRDRRRLGDRRRRERHRLGAPRLHRLPGGHASGGDQHARCSR